MLSLLEQGKNVEMERLLEKKLGEMENTVLTWEPDVNYLTNRIRLNSYIYNVQRPTNGRISDIYLTMGR